MSRPAVRQRTHVNVDVLLTTHIVDFRVRLADEVNTWNDELNAAYHCETGEILRAWNMPFRDDASSHSPDVGEAYLSFWSGTDPERPGAGLVRTGDGLHVRQGHLRARRPDAFIWVVPPVGWMKGF